MNDQPTDPTNSEREIFLEALQCETPEKCAAYLDRVCAGNPALRHGVESLLKHHRADEFMQPPGLSSALPSALEKPGDRVGRYKLLQLIGEGGCGTVYMAEQQEPVRRQVALKVIKLGMDTKNVIARFEAERQALALMDHPNIAKVFDANATETGRPYFVMELVRGIKITDYCDQNKLSTRQRLRLFIQVCHAIQHAHQKGIIHRDIKPSNVLVTLRDGVPVPKVIDFGIAKATGDQRLTDKTLFTAFEQFIGTPAYMSPEQAEMSELGVDTRSDIYSLGVLLYELLTGQTPFDSKQLLQSGLDEIRRIIREEEPALPSTRFNTMTHADLAEVARHRQSEPAKLKTLMRGELDWIAMKALEKDRGRRYETVNSLAADVQRYLADEPVVARPSSNLYRLQKTVRRHKLAVAAFSAVALSLIGGLSLSTWLLVQETQARHRAVTAENHQAQLRQQAETLRAAADDKSVQIRHQLYASHMNLAFHAWDRGDIAATERLIDEQRPKAGEEDERGFEWFLLWQLCHSAKLTLSSQGALARCVVFSPDGAVLAAAADDSTVRLWDANTGKLLRVLFHKTGGVYAVAFSPDGKVLATAGQDKAIRLWDLSTGMELASLHGIKLGITAIAFSPDGQWLASATGRLGDGITGNPYQRLVALDHLEAEIDIWDLQSHQKIKTLGGYKRSILSLAISPDGKTIASGGGESNAAVRIWDVTSGSLVTNFPGFNGPVISVAFSPDGKSLAVGGGNPYLKQGEFRILDVPTFKYRLTFKGHEGPVFAVAFSPNGKTLASGGYDQIIRIWDSGTGEEIRTIKGHRSLIGSLAFDPGGHRLAAASWDGTIKVWDAEHTQGMDRYPDVGTYRSSFSPDGKFLASANNTVNIIEVGTDKPPSVLPDYKTGDTSVAFSPDGALLATAGSDHMVTLWQTGTWKQVGKLQGHRSEIWEIGFSPNGRTLASDDVFTSIRLWDVANRRQIADFPCYGAWGPPLFTPDERTLIGSGAGPIVFWDITTGRKEERLGGVTRCLAISAGGLLLAVACGSDLALLDAKTLAEKWRMSAHRAFISQGRFSPDGKTLATTSWDGTAKLWDVASGQEMFSYRASGVVWSEDFSPDAKWYAVGSGSAYKSEEVLFRAATPAEIKSFEIPPVILIQPASQTVTEGGKTVFNVFVSGDLPVTYKWLKNGASLPGQNQAALRLANVSATDAGIYTVVASNQFGSVTSSNAQLTVLPVRVGPSEEMDFQDKRPASCFAFTDIDDPPLLKTNLAIIPNAGLHGAAALVLTMDGSGFNNGDKGNQDWSRFGADIPLTTRSVTNVTTTDLNLYRMEATAKTTGLLGTNARGVLTAQFLTASGPVLTVSYPITLTTNYQVFSFILGNGTIDPNSPGSWSDFVADFNQITSVDCRIGADDWIDDYFYEKESSLYVADVKFVHLTPEAKTTMK